MMSRDLRKQLAVLPCTGLRSQWSNWFAKSMTARDFDDSSAHKRELGWNGTNDDSFVCCSWQHQKVVVLQHKKRGVIEQGTSATMRKRRHTARSQCQKVGCHHLPKPSTGPGQARSATFSLWLLMSSSSLSVCLSVHARLHISCWQSKPWFCLRATYLGVGTVFSSFLLYSMVRCLARSDFHSMSQFDLLLGQSHEPVHSLLWHYFGNLDFTHHSCPLNILLRLWQWCPAWAPEKIESFSETQSAVHTSCVELAFPALVHQVLAQQKTLWRHNRTWAVHGARNKLSPVS